MLAVKILQERDKKVGRGFGTGDLWASLGGAGAVDTHLLAGAPGTEGAMLLDRGGLVRHRRAESRRLCQGECHWLARCAAATAIRAPR